MNLTSRRPIPLALLLATLLAACTSGSEDPSASPTPEATPTTEATATASATPAPTADPTPSATTDPPTATVRRGTLDVWPWPMNEGTPMGTLARGDSVEIDARRFGWVRLQSGGWITAHPEFTQLSVDLSALPVLEAPTHDPATRTGDPLIDRVIDAALDADADALLALAAFEDTPCVEDGDTGDFLCPDGVAAGTVIPVFGFVGCHGIPSTREETRTEFERWSRDSIGLYAVFRDAGSIVLLLTRDGAALTVPLTADGRMRYVDAGCGQRPPEWVAGRATGFILPPLEVPASRLYGPETRTGIPLVDALLDARTDPAARPPVALSEAPCTTQTAGRPGEPPCPDGVAAGTIIEVFATATCEPSFLFDLETAEAQVDRALGRDGLRLYAVAELTRPTPQTGPARYVVTLAESLQDQVAPVVFLSEQAIVAVYHGCGSPTQGAASGPFLLPPISGP